MFNLRHTFGVATLLLASTSMFAAPTYPGGGEHGSNVTLYAQSDLIEGWFVGADASYGSSVFFYIEADNGDIAWASNPFFVRNGGTSTPGGLLDDPTAYREIYNNDLPGSIIGKKVGFGLNVYTSGNASGAPNYTFYTSEVQQAATGSGPRAYVVTWNVATDGDLGGALTPFSMLLYVGFEDQINPSDFDYNDHQFVFSGVGTDNPVPEPSTWAMMITGVAGLGLGVWRRRRAATVVSDDKQ